MIIIFSIQNELSTNNVMDHLRMMGEEVIRINSDDDVYKFQYISNQDICFINTQNGKKYNLLDAKSCWWRRTGLSRRNFDNGLRREEFKTDEFDFTSLISKNRNILAEESRGLIDYIFNKVYSNCKINLGSPLKYELNKLSTLELAKKNDMLIPKYEIISNSNQISLRDSRIISKSIVEGVYEVIDNNSFYTYTEELVGELDENVNLFPSLIMELIEKELEIRTFYIEGKFYSMAIFSQSSEQTSVDFRKYNLTKPNRTELYKLPAQIEEKLHRIFIELELNTGSIDMILDKKGDYYFLEINPVGQYDMVSRPCNYNLDYVIAKYLKNGKIKNN